MIHERTTEEEDAKDASAEEGMEEYENSDTSND